MATALGVLLPQLQVRLLCIEFLGEFRVSEAQGAQPCSPVGLHVLAGGLPEGGILWVMWVQALIDHGICTLQHMGSGFRPWAQGQKAHEITQGIRVQGIRVRRLGNAGPHRDALYTSHEILSPMGRPL